MKIAIECKSPLLQKSLELFLYDHLSSSKSCDIFIKDKKCTDDVRCFYISSDSDADLTKPFSKQELILALEKRYSSSKKSIEKPESKREEFIDEEKIKISEPIKKRVEKKENDDRFSLLEKRIELLTQEYQKNLINTIKAFYEK